MIYGYLKGSVDHQIFSENGVQVDSVFQDTPNDDKAFHKMISEVREDDTVVIRNTKDFKVGDNFVTLINQRSQKKVNLKSLEDPQNIRKELDVFYLVLFGSSLYKNEENIKAIS